MEQRWEIINIAPMVPKCNLCDKTTDQMARFYIQPVTIYICSVCAKYVKECMNKWKELKSTDYIEETDWDISFKIHGAVNVPKPQT